MGYAQVHAYDNNHIGISYSTFSPLLEDIKDEGFTFSRTTGNLGMDFTYGVEDRIALSFQLNYSYFETDLIKLKVGNGNFFSQYSGNTYQMWIKGDYHYSNDNFYEGTLYSSIAFGYMYTISKRLNEVGLHNSNIPKLSDLVYSNGLVYQIYPIAYKREFRKSFGGFVELGYGFQGILKAGIYVRIDRKIKKAK